MSCLPQHRSYTLIRPDIAWFASQEVRVRPRVQREIMGLFVRCPQEASKAAPRITFWTAGPPVGGASLACGDGLPQVWCVDHLLPSTCHGTVPA